MHRDLGIEHGSELHVVVARVELSHRIDAPHLVLVDDEHLHDRGAVVEGRERRAAGRERLRHGAVGRRCRDKVLLPVVVVVPFLGFGERRAAVVVQGRRGVDMQRRGRAIQRGGRWQHDGGGAVRREVIELVLIDQLLGLESLGCLEAAEHDAVDRHAPHLTVVADRDVGAALASHTNPAAKRGGILPHALRRYGRYDASRSVRLWSREHRALLQLQLLLLSRAGDRAHVATILESKQIELGIDRPDVLR